MNRLQTFHEALIPMLVEAVGARSYLELGTGDNQTIGRVRCEKRFGVDERWVQCPGVTQFTMSTAEFIRDHALKHSPYDAIFLDATHDSEEMIAELELLWPLLSPEGLMFLHDVNPENLSDTDSGLCGSAWKVPMLLAGQGKEIVVLPFHPGLAILRKRETWGPRDASVQAS